jgi:hypothetical protein
MTNHILKNESKTLLHLFKKLDQLNELNQIFAQYVEPGIVTHCRVANLQNNCLIVIVDNGNWATQLRFQIPTLIANMRQHAVLANLKAICCKTRPATHPQNTRKKRKTIPMKAISEETAKEMLQIAKNVADDKLRKILEKIARSPRLREDSK